MQQLKGRRQLSSSLRRSRSLAGLTHAAGHLIRRSRRARLAVAAVAAVVVAVVVAVVQSSSHDHLYLTRRSASFHLVCDHSTVARLPYPPSAYSRHRLPSTNTGSSSKRPRYGTVTPTPPPASPHAASRSAATTRTYSIIANSAPRRHHQPTRLSTRETLSTPSHHIIFRIRHSSHLSTSLSLFTPPLHHTLLITATPISPQTNPASP